MTGAPLPAEPFPALLIGRVPPRFVMLFTSKLFHCQGGLGT